MELSIGDENQFLALRALVAGSGKSGHICLAIISWLLLVFALCYTLLVLLLVHTE